jgi:hypothetical protein
VAVGARADVRRLQRYSGVADVVIGPLWELFCGRRQLIIGTGSPVKPRQCGEGEYH